MSRETSEAFIHPELIEGLQAIDAKELIARITSLEEESFREVLQGIHKVLYEQGLSSLDTLDAGYEHSNDPRLPKPSDRRHHAFDRIVEGEVKMDNSKGEPSKFDINVTLRKFSNSADPNGEAIQPPGILININTFKGNGGRYKEPGVRFELNPRNSAIHIIKYPSKSQRNMKKAENFWLSSGMMQEEPDKARILLFVVLQALKGIQILTSQELQRKREEAETERASKKKEIDSILGDF